VRVVESTKFLCLVFYWTLYLDKDQKDELNWLWYYIKGVAVYDRE